MKEKPPFNLVELIVAIVLLGVLALSVIYAIDPVEQARKDRDEYYRESAKEFVQAVNKDAVKKDSLSIGGSLPWTKIGDLAPLTDLLVSDGFLPGGFKNNRFVTSDKLQELIVVGRGQEENLVWACYTPESQAGRVDHIALRALTLGEPLPQGGEPEYCPGPPDWMNTFCWSCVSQKLEVK